MAIDVAVPTTALTLTAPAPFVGVSVEVPTAALAATGSNLNVWVTPIEASDYVVLNVGLAAQSSEPAAAEYVHANLAIVPEVEPAAAEYVHGDVRGLAVPAGPAKGLRIWTGTEWLDVWAAGMPLDLLGDVSKQSLAPSDPQLDDVWLDLSQSPPVWRIWLDVDGTEEWVTFGGGGGGGGAAECDLYGDGVATTIDVAHGLATSCLLVEVSEVASGDALVHGTDYTWLILNDDTIRVVFTVAPATEDVRIVVAAGAAGSSGGEPVPAWVSHLAVPDDGPVWADEFDGPEFDADWTEIVASGTAVWTQARSLASVRFASQGSASVAAILNPYALPVGHAVETFMRVVGVQANHLMAGPIVTDGIVSSSGCVWLMPYTSTNWSLRAGTLGSINATLREASFDLLRRGEVYLRLIHVAENTWRSQGSPDGVSWTTFNLSDVARTLTPSHVGFGVSVWGGGASERIASFEYLRVYDLAG